MSPGWPQPTWRSMLLWPISELWRMYQLPFEFRDEQYDGKPLPGINCGWYYPENGPSRGTVFKSRDGSGMTFVSDTVIRDYWQSSGINVSGNLYLKNGVRYRIDNGGVSRITDRNGNWINFVGFNNSNGYGYVATDSLGRETKVETAPDSITTITSTRENNVTRAIKIYPGGQLRSDYQPLTYAQAFPELNGSVRDWGNSLVGTIGISRVELPDGRNYRFYHNQYSDIARIELPTGGAYEYEWAGVGTASGAYASPDNADPRYTRGYIYRRVNERRIYDNGATGANYTSKTSITGTIAREYVAGNATPISRTDHFYYGD